MNVSSHNQDSEPSADAARVAALCRYIEAHSDEPLSLERLAEQAGWSRFHLQRRFKALAGLSPRQYHEAVRLRRFREGLRVTDSVTTAIVDAGYGSSSRLYERSAAHLGMTPKQYRKGGEGVALSYACEPTELGILLMAASDRGLCFVQFADTEAELVDRLRDEFPNARIDRMPAASAPQMTAWMSALGAYLSGRQRQLELPVDLRGTAFQHQVWRFLLQTRPGDVLSYAEVAAAIGKPKAVRAVASACAANRVGVVVPCHRVIRGDGSLGGYRWGLDRKRALLAVEQRMRAVTTE
jgi:AraC family transcriptional regulator of adaptative response/methylated-DNA-[protein]-cysteine methyltransferase